MPSVFVCNGPFYFRYPLAADTSEDFSVQYGLCNSGDGDWVDVEALAGTPETPVTAGELTPEQFQQLKDAAAGGFSSGFVVMATGLVIVASIRWVVEFVKKG